MSHEQNRQNKGYRGKLESIGSLIFLVMILAVSINQAQTGNKALIMGGIESTQEGGQPRAILTSEAKQEIDEHQNDDDRKMTVEKLRSASTQENEITSVIGRALKYLAGTYDYALAAVQK